MFNIFCEVKCVLLFFMHFFEFACKSQLVELSSAIVVEYVLLFGMEW
jgi:hypothetical protein